jgi:predicted GIY-YIG superfamily endonuclease
VTACTRARRPRLQTRLPRLELDIELTRIELGYRAALAMEIEHIRPDLVRHRAEMAVRIARHRQAAAGAALAGAYGRQPVVYLLHFDQRYRHAGHYTGWTEDLAARLARHAVGDGARLLEVVHQAGITWQLARIWPGPRARERQLKRQGGASRHCPLCKRPRCTDAIPGGGR